MSYEQDLQSYFNYIQGIQFPAIIGQMDNILLYKLVSMLSKPLSIGNYEDEYSDYLDYLNSKYRWSSDSERNFLLFRLVNIISKVGNSQYLGTWNASSNTPNLASYPDLKIGDWLIVNEAGTYNNIEWDLYDTVKWDGTTWTRIPYPAADTTIINNNSETIESSVIVNLTDDYSIETTTTTRFHYLSTNGVSRIVNLPSATLCPNRKYSIVNKSDIGMLSLAIQGVLIGLDIPSGGFVSCHSDSFDWNFYVNKI